MRASYLVLPSSSPHSLGFEWGKLFKGFQREREISENESE